LGSSPVFGVIRVAHILVFCVVCLRPVSCVPNVVSFSGLSIIDFLFGFLERLCSTTLNFCTDDIVSFGSFGQAVSEENIFRNRPTRSKNCMWLPCLLTNQHELNNLHRRPSKDDFYQVSIHLTSGFRVKDLFRNRPIRKKESSMVAMFADRSRRYLQSL
jgi:hypothetical protein